MSQGVLIRYTTPIEPENNMYVFYGVGDPSVAGCVAGKGSIYIQLDSTPPGAQWTKNSKNDDTDWSLRPSGGTTLTTDTTNALAGTTGTPSATNKFVTDSDTRLTSIGGTQLNVQVSTAPSAGTALVGDGTTDDGPALSTLANTTMSAKGTIYHTPGKTYRIATATTIPAGVVQQIPANTTFKVDGVVLTIRGAISAGLYPIFQYVNGGSVLFTATNAEASSKRAVAVTEVYPEWWGAKADGSNDDAPAIQACITAVSGLPAATSGSRWASAMIRLAQGSYYCHSTLQVASLHGLRIEGAGYQSSKIAWKGASLSSTATAGSTTTLTDSGQAWTTNQYAPGVTTWYAYIKSGTGIGQWAQIASNTATVLTFAAAITTAPDATSGYYIVPQTLLDLDGCFDGQMQGFTLDGGNYVRHGLYYHWLGSVSAASSSRLKLTNVQVTGGTVDSAFQFGGFDTTELNQADMAGLYGCQALAGVADTGLYQNGFRFGSGAFSNPLNYSCYGCEAVGYTNGVTVASTNVNWFGGTIQSNTNDIYFLNGVQGYSSFSGFRSEKSQRLVNSESSQQIAMNVRLSDINFQLNGFANNPTTNAPDLIYWALPGNLILDSVSTAAGQSSARTLTSATSTTATSTGWGLSTTAGGVTGWNALITAGTGAGQRRIIASNTSTQITVGTAWVVTPDATSQVTLYPAPRVALSNTTTVIARGCAMQGTPAEGFLVPVSGSAARGTSTGYQEVDILINAVGTTVLQNAMGGTSNVLPKATQAFGVIGSAPDAVLTRHKNSTLGTAALEGGSVRALKYGAIPAPFVDKGAGSGSTSYSYFLVAKDGHGNALGLPSAAGTVTGQAATLAYNTAYNRVWLPNGNHIPAPAYDILRGDTSHSVALDVPYYKLPFHDDRTTTDAYTAPTVDATGSLTVDAAASVGGALSVAGPTTVAAITASGPITANGGIVGPVTVVTKTANYTALTTDQVILCDCSSSAITITLPTSVAFGAHELAVIKVDSSTNAVTILASGSDSINGATTQTISGQFGGYDLLADGGTKWVVLATTAGSIASIAASNVLPGAFASGNYTFPGALTVTQNFTQSSSGTGNFNGPVTFTNSLHVNGPAFMNEHVTGNSGSALTVSQANGACQKITLTANCTFTYASYSAGSQQRLVLVQDATGSRTVTWPAAADWGTPGAPTLSTAAGAVDVIDIYYDGTKYWHKAYLLGLSG